MNSFLKLDVSIKFRAFGVTYGNYNEKVTFPLPELAASLLSAVHVGVFDKHGVKIVATIVDNPLGI